MFSPDSYRLAVTQSDGLVVVYRIGGSWKEKKSISNKFRQSVAVVGVVWPARGEDSEQLVFGGVDGKVKLGNLRTNKPASLYAAESPLLCMCGSPNGNCVLTAHLDGSVYKFSFDDGSGRPSKCRLWVHPCPPLAMAWSARDEVAAGGSDGRIRFFSPNSGSERLSVALAGGDCSSLCFSPSGLALTAGTFHRVTVFETGLSSASTWRKGQVLEIPGLYTASALCWRADGTRLAVGSLCGAVELFDAHTTRHLLKGRFVVTFSAPSDAVVTDRDTGARVRVKSGSGTALHSVDVARADLVVGRTDRSVIMGLLSSPAASASGAFAPLATEVPWSRPALEGGKRERVLMVPGEPGLLLIAAPGGEVSVVDLSNNSNGQQQPVVGSFWTGSLVAERVSAVRLAGGRVRVAYLTDKATAQVVDLPEAVQVAASLRLPGPASRLLLSPSGALLAVSVGAGSLIVHPLGMGVKAGPGPGLGPTAAAAALAGRPTTAAAAAAMAGSLDQGPAVVLLARGCRGALWVPGTDVLVGLYDGTLAMWPLPTASAPMVVARDLPERSKLVSVDAGAATARVVVAGGAEDDAGAVEVALDGPLLRLHASVTRAPLLEAVAALDACPLEREDAAAPLWGLLLRRALMSALPPSTSGAAVAAAATAEGASRLRAETLRVAIRCAGALGDTAKSRFLESLARECSPSEGERSPVHLHIIFLAGLAMLRSDFAEAENLLLSGGLADRAIAMYKSLGSWRQAVTLALTTGHPKAQSIAREHEAWLAKTGQFAHAARLHEDAGETARAVELYLWGGAPARAAELIVASDRKAVGETTARAVADRLTSCGLWLPAAKVLEWLGGQPEQAVSLYAKAERFGEAVRLCRRHKDTALADRIPALEREWGAALLRDGYPEVAAGHFAEAGEHAEAAAACAAAGTWGKCLSHLTKVLPELAGDPMLPAAVASQAAPQADQLAPLFLIPSLRVAPPQKGGLYSTALSAASHLLSTAPNTSVLLAASAGEPLLALALRVCATRLALGGGSDLARRAVQAGLPASAPDYQALTEVLAAAGRPEDAALAQAMVSTAAPAASSKKTARRLSKDNANAAPAASPRGSPSPKPKKREPERLMAARDWAGALAALQSLGSSPLEAALAVCRRVLPGPDAPSVAAAIGDSLDPALAALIEEGSLEAAEALLVTASADAQGRNQASALALSSALVAAGQEGHAVSLLVSLGLASAAVDVLIGKGLWESALALARDRCPERVPAIERASAPQPPPAAPPAPAVSASASILSPPSARAASSGRARSGGKVRKEKVLAVLSGVRDGDDAAAKAAADVLQHKVTLERLEELHESLVVPRSGVSALALEVLSQVYARRLCSERHRATVALAVLARSPSLRMPETAEVLVVCARDLLAGVELVPRGAPWIGVVHQLRAQLGRVERDPGTELFQTTEWVVHLQWVATLSAWKALQGDAAGSRALKTVSAKAAIALLRHCDALAVDRAFFEAGMASRECGLARAAFSFFTRYLDLAEAMADTEGTFDLDNQIFEDTDLPADFSLPFHTSITADEQEEVRSWLLQQSLDDSGPALPTAPCPHCAKPKYSASLACFACETRFQPCVVTGFPLLKERATCQHCDRQANKTDWATYLSAMQGLCPWCNEKV